MTYFVTTLAETLHIGAALSALKDAYRSGKQKLAFNREVNATIKELNRLSDHELADIGITRGMIRTVAMESHRRVY